MSDTPKLIYQGDIYWALAAKQSGEDKGIPHPQIVLQDDLFNHSRIQTVIVCGLTSNLKRVSEPGNFLLNVGEANLEKPSVVLVSQLESLNKSDLGEWIGRLSAERVEQILAGIRFQQRAYFRSCLELS